MTEGQNPTLTRLAEIEARLTALDSKEREMSEITVAATEHEGNTVAVKSLHERLREAAGDTWVNSRRSCETSYYRVPNSALAAIEAELTEPLRAEVARLERYEDEWMAMAVKRDAQYNALKARADAVVGAAKNALNVADREMDTTPNVVLSAAYAMCEPLAAYDAADRAGETQDGRMSPEEWSAKTKQDWDDTVAKHASAPSPTGAAAEGEKNYVFGNASFLEQMHGAAEERQRWKEGVDRTLADLERWRKGVDQKWYESEIPERFDRVEHHVQALEQRLDALRGPEATTADLDAMTEEFFSAFWEDDIVRDKVDWSDEIAPHIERAVRAGLEAALSAKDRK